MTYLAPVGVAQIDPPLGQNDLPPGQIDLPFSTSKILYVWYNVLGG